jgi:hypothetical protein
MTVIEKRIEALDKRNRENYLRLAEDNSVSKIYTMTKNAEVAPGFYEVIEPDFGGMTDIVQFVIHVEKLISQKELALNLYEEHGYRSAWTYLSIRKARQVAKYNM